MRSNLAASQLHGLNGCPGTGRRRAHPYVVALGLAFGLAAAGTGYGAVWKRPVPVAPFRITEHSGEVGFLFDYLQETQKGADGESIKFENRAVEEFIRNRWRAYIYHPDLVDLRVATKFGLLQQMVKRSKNIGDTDNGVNGSGNFDLYSYDVQAQVLKNHPASFDLFANRDRDIVRELFTDRLFMETDAFGGVARLKDGWFPMNLSYRRGKFREFGSDSLSESKSDTFEYSVTNDIAKRIRSEFHYRLNTFDQKFTAQNPLVNIKNISLLDSQDISFQNRINFTERGENSLFSLYRTYDQSGTQQFQNQYWQERLNLKHPGNLRSYYSFSLLKSQLSGADVQNQRDEVGLDHKLFQSLDSHIDYHSNRNDYTNASDTQSGMTARLLYRKHTPWGRLSAGYARTEDQIDRTGGSNERQILGESLTLLDGVTVYLSQPNVMSGTIVVMDPTRTITYDEGFDYQIEILGERTGLRLLLGGRLSDGSTVLVDYRIGVTSDISYSQTDQSYNARFDFERGLKGLSLYYRYHDLAPTGLDSTSDISILEYTSRIYGFAYEWRWLRWIEEMENYQSNFESYDQLRSELEGKHRLNSYLQWGWRLGMTSAQYSGGETLAKSRDVQYAGANVRGSQPRWGYWELEARARKETGWVDQTLFGVMGKAGFQWRKLNISASFRMDQRSQVDTERTRTHFVLEVARKF